MGTNDQSHNNLIIASQEKETTFFNCLTPSMCPVSNEIVMNCINSI